MACWEAGYDEPWFLVTDWAPDQAEGLGSGMRSWIEGGYKLLKIGGWQWQATRITEPDRAERLWLVANGAVTPFDGDLDDYRRLVLSDRGGEAKPTTDTSPRTSRAEMRRAAIFVAPARLFIDITFTVSPSSNSSSPDKITVLSALASRASLSAGSNLSSLTFC